tara:strand:- start:1961 stop:2809 length:849 start_codon:yes stop_codon:yes gene_type:complete
MSFVRQVFWDSNFPILRLKGKGTKAFLHGQLTSGILNANTNSLIYGCWLSSKGFVKALVEIFLTDEGADLLVIGGDIKEIYKGFDQVIFPADKVFIELNHHVRRVQSLNLREPWKENDVFWLSENQALPKALESQHQASKQELEMWRLHQGIPLINSEINGETNPFELGLFDLVNLEKGCYLGQEIIARLLRGTSLKQKLRFWTSKNKVMPGEKIINLSTSSKLENQRVAGVITSSAINQSSGSYGLALIRSNCFDEDTLWLLNSKEKIFLESPLGFVEINI